jgi:dUTPase
MSSLVSVDYDTFKNVFATATHHTHILYLNLYVAQDAELKDLYLQAANTHNSKLANDPHFYDAGFDLFLPKLNDASSKRDFRLNVVNKVDFKVKCAAEMRYLNNDSSKIGYYSPFYLHPRSSLSKTPLRLANSTGIIDAGYRGNLIGMFDCVENTEFFVGESKIILESYIADSYSRLLQICGPGLVPIYVNVVDEETDLGVATNRGQNGLGSTGI